MLKSSLCDYSNAYIPMSGTITITVEGVDNNSKRTNKGVIFKDYAPSTGCKSEINNTKVDNAKVLVVVILVYKLIE